MAETDTTTGSAAERSTSRRSPASKSPSPMSSASGSNAGDEFTCPACGRSFGRAAALGAHRRSHGVVGKKSGSQRPTGKRSSRSRSSSRANSASSTSGRRGRSTQRTAGVNRDALLRALFPNGVPAREQTLSAVSAWLDEAQRLAGLR